MDQGAIADRGLFEALRSLAEAGGIPWQTMRSVAGRTDTAAIQRTNEGVRTAAVSIPVRYPRTPSGVTCLRDAEAALALIRAAGYERPCLLGTSGGAWAAMNAALLAPGAVGAVVADSFDGRSLHPGFARDLTAERDRAKRDKAAREFYAWCQGPDWEAVVDRDTDALLRCAASGRPLFCGPLEQMRPPVLLMGSREDPMCRQDLEEEYKAMAAQMPHAAVRLFASGGHPAILSRAEAAKEEILAFWLRCEAAERL